MDMNNLKNTRNISNKGDFVIIKTNNDFIIKNRKLLAIDVMDLNSSRRLF